MFQRLKQRRLEKIRLKNRKECFAYYDEMIARGIPVNTFSVERDTKGIRWKITTKKQKEEKPKTEAEAGSKKRGRPKKDKSQEEDGE